MGNRVQEIEEYKNSRIEQYYITIFKTLNLGFKTLNLGLFANIKKTIWRLSLRDSIQDWVFLLFAWTKKVPFKFSNFYSIGYR